MKAMGLQDFTNVVGRSGQGSLCQGHDHTAPLYQHRVRSCVTVSLRTAWIADEQQGGVRRWLPEMPWPACRRCPWEERSFG